MGFYVANLVFVFPTAAVLLAVVALMDRDTPLIEVHVGDSYQIRDNSDCDVSSEF